MNVTPYTVERTRTQVRFVTVAVIVTSLMIVGGLSLPMLPYNAMTIYNYEPTKTEVCPLEVLSAKRDYEIKRDAGVYAIEVDPMWIAVDVPQVEKGAILRGHEAQYTSKETKPGRRKAESSILRAAPPQPGEWAMGATITVRGTPVLFIPQSEVLEVTADQTVRVLEAETKECVVQRGSVQVSP